MDRAGHSVWYKLEDGDDVPQSRQDESAQESGHQQKHRESSLVENNGEERPKHDGHWCVDYGRARKFDEAGEMFLLQEDGASCERLPTIWAGGIKEEGPGEVCICNYLGINKGTEGGVYKDGDGRRRSGFLKKRTESTTMSSTISTEHVQVAEIEKNTMNINISISDKSLEQKKEVKTTALLDTGAGGKFID
jgi:hypothetical protein